jgi:hypothetical protein
MGKPLGCRIGWHKWTVRFTDDGSRFRQCVRCEKVDDSTRPPPGSAFAAGG